MYKTKFLQTSFVISLLAILLYPINVSAGPCWCHTEVSGACGTTMDPSSYASTCGWTHCTQQETWEECDKVCEALSPGLTGTLLGNGSCPG
ncbi:MAG: hypothetical protein HYX35_02765 [Proteobacteria bacterium]|nr:hypothetical protein [Pseudomonadota bacterium]